MTLEMMLNHGFSNHQAPYDHNTDLFYEHKPSIHVLDKYVLSHLIVGVTRSWIFDQQNQISYHMF